MTALRQRAEELRARREPFVHARVVLAERPTSAKPGDEALILSDGAIEGFVGGDCAEDTVRTKGLAVLASGESMLLRIAAAPEAEQAGKTVVHNPCLSGGTLEIFLEPILPTLVVSVFGESPIAAAMAGVGQALGYDVQRLDGALPDGVGAVLVAAHGRGDEDRVLIDAVRAEVPYVGLIASPKRGAAVVGSLDLDDDQKRSIRTPAGLDIGARSPAEIALSVYAQIIAERVRPRAGEPAAAQSVDDAGETAVDPVCGMTVVISDTALHAEVEGVDHYFCGAGCRRAFLADPSTYVGS